MNCAVKVKLMQAKKLIFDVKVDIFVYMLDFKEDYFMFYGNFY